MLETLYHWWKPGKQGKTLGRKFKWAYFHFAVLIECHITSAGGGGGREETPLGWGVEN